METQNVELEFKRMFAHALGLYPNSGGHEGSAASYWQFLRRYPLPVLRNAFRRACLSSPEFLPSAVRVRECAEAAARTVAGLPPPERKSLPPGGREYVPPVGAGAEEWINEAPNRFERLGRMWACESKLRGWDRTGEVPQENGERRWKELWALWDQGTESMNGQRQTGNGSASARSGSSGSRQSAGSSPAPGLSHGDGCVCEECMPVVMRLAEGVGL